MFPNRSVVSSADSATTKLSEHDQVWAMLYGNAPKSSHKKGKNLRFLMRTMLLVKGFAVEFAKFLGSWLGTKAEAAVPITCFRDSPKAVVGFVGGAVVSDIFGWRGSGGRRDG